MMCRTYVGHYNGSNIKMKIAWFLFSRSVHLKGCVHRSWQTDGHFTSIYLGNPDLTYKTTHARAHTHPHSFPSCDLCSLLFCLQLRHPGVRHRDPLGLPLAWHAAGCLADKRGFGAVNMGAWKGLRGLLLWLGGEQEAWNQLGLCYWWPALPVTDLLCFYHLFIIYYL